MNKKCKGLFPLLLIIAGVIAYSNSFNGVYVDWDDKTSIDDNPHFRKLWPLSEAISLPLWNTGATFNRRPIVSLSFAINHFFFGHSLWGYHLVNLIIHLLNALLAFAILKQIFAQTKFLTETKSHIAFATALIWVVHPLNTESVTFLVQRAESLMAFFFLLAVYTSIRGFTETRKLRWYSISVISCFLGMGSKEVMVVCPILIFLLDYIFFTDKWKNRWKYYLPLFASWSVLACVITLTLEDALTDFTTRNPIEYALCQPATILQYLKLSFWPSPLMLHYYWPFPETIAKALLPLVIVALLGSLTIIGIIRKHPLGFLGAWFFFILGPSSSFAALTDRICEHRMYLPLLAVVSFFIISLFSILKKIIQTEHKSKTAQKTMGSLLAISVITLTFLTLHRNKDYHNDLDFAFDNTEKREGFAAAHFNLAEVLTNEGEYHKVIEQLQTTLGLRNNDKGKPPPYEEVHRLMGDAYKELRNYKEAITHYKMSLIENPLSLDAYIGLGEIAYRQNASEKAIKYYKIALEKDPQYAPTHFALGRLFELTGKTNEAIPHFEKAISTDPSSANAHYRLSLIFSKQKKHERASYHLQKAREIEPDNEEYDD